MVDVVRGRRRDDRAIPFALGEDLAAPIPNAELLPLPGHDHLPWLGGVKAVVDPTLAHLSGQEIRRTTRTAGSEVALTGPERAAQHAGL
jgi:hypothetical protein